MPNDTWPGDSSLSQTPNRGLIVVAFLQARISDLTYIVPELAYIQRGAKVDNVSFYTNARGQSTYVTNGSIQVDAEFIELSTRFMLKLGSDRIKVCPNLGPMVGINLSSQSTYTYSTYPTRTVIDNQSIPPIELGLQLGLTLEISASETISYLLNGGYTFGLTDYGAVYGLPIGNLASRDPQLSLAMSFAL
jgi:hypothetical protein